MPSLICPHCAGIIDLLALPRSIPATRAPEENHSAHVTTTSSDRALEILRGTAYRPNPAKTYRTSEAERRRGLAHYYRHRDTILRKARERRRAKQGGVASVRAPRVDSAAAS